MWRPLSWRREPLVVRKATLASVLAKAAVGIRFNAHMDFDDGEAVFYHTCLVSKRKDFDHRSGRSPDWLERLGLSSYKSQSETVG